MSVTCARLGLPFAWLAWYHAPVPSVRSACVTVVLIACGSADPPVAHPPVSVAKIPVSAPLGPTVPSFDCSLDVCARTEGVATFLVGNQEVLLYNASRQGPTESLPMVALGQRRIVALDLTRSPGETHTQGWAKAQLLDDMHTIVGIVENAVESTGSELLVLVSRNAGESFRIEARLEKPHYTAEVRDLLVRGRKRWTIVLNLFDCAGCSVAAGRYVATTEDAGKTFTAFTRQSDGDPTR